MMVMMMMLLLSAPRILVSQAFAHTKSSAFLFHNSLSSLLAAQLLSLVDDNDVNEVIRC